MADDMMNETSPLSPQMPADDGSYSPMSEPKQPELLFNPIQVKPQDGEDLDLALRRMLDMHVAEFEKRATWRKPFETLWRKIYELYMTRDFSTRLATRARVVLPKVFQGIEAAVPKLVSIIFGKTPWFETKSVWPFRPVSSDVLANITALLGHQLNLAGFFKKFIEFCKQLLLYGNSYMLVTWKVRREWVTERVLDRTPRTIFGIPVGVGTGEWKVKKELKVVERRPEITVLPIDAVYPAPDQIEVEDGTGIYYTDSMSLDDLKELSTGRAPVYANFDQLKELIGSNSKGSKSGRQEESDLPQEKASIRGLNDPTSASAGGTKNVSLLHYWGKADLDGDGFREEVHIVIANKSVIIRAVPNPYEHQKRPIIKGTMFPVPKEWFGMGMVEPAIPTLAAENTLYAQVIDMNNLIINRMWKVDPNMDVDLDTLVSTPNGIALASPLDAIQELRQDPLPFSPVQMIQSLEQEIESTMAPKAIQGTPDSGALGRTARGAQLIIGQALEKFGTAAKLIEDTVLKSVLTQMHQLNGQYLDQDKYLQDIYASIFQTPPTPEEIRQLVSFEFLGVSETITKEATVNQITAFVTVWANILGPQAMIPLAREHYKLLDIKMPVDEALPANMPLPPAVIPPGASQPGPTSDQAASVVNQMLNNGGASGGVQVPPVNPQ